MKNLKNWGLDKKINLNNIVDENQIYSKNLLNKTGPNRISIVVNEKLSNKNLKILRN